MFICHSLGCLFTVRYLVKHNLRIKAAIFVAAPGGRTVSNKDIKKKMYLQGFQGRFLPSLEIRHKFKELCGKRFSIYSDNDHILSLRSLRAFAKSVVAGELMIPGQGHFGKAMGTREIPEVLEIVKREIGLD